MELIRRITAATSTIPQGVAGTGTISFPASGLTGVVAGAVTWTSANNDFKNGFTAGGAENLWLYIPSIPAIKKITSAHIETNGTDLAVSVVIETTFGVGAIAAAAFQVINADLRRYTILNDGAANATINGIILTSNPGENFIENQKSDYPVGNLLDAVLVVASTTDVLVTEQLD